MKKNMERQLIAMTVTTERAHEESRVDDALLFFVLEGELELSIDGAEQTLLRGDTALINPNQLWSYAAKEPLLLAKVPILYDLISTSACGFRVRFIRNPKSRILTSMLSDMLIEGDLNPDNNKIYAYDACYYRLIQYLLDHCLDREALANRESGDDRMDSIMEYIHQGYSRHITLAELSEDLYLSTGYLSRFFTKHFGMSFSQYLMKVRLQHIKDEMLYTDKPITQIAYDCGFSSISLFNRSFKKAYGITPSAYREKALKEPAPEHAPAKAPEYDSLIKKYLSENAQTRETFHFEIDTTAATAPFVSPCRIINVGAAANLRSALLQEHLKLLRETAGFTHVRMWGLFSPDILMKETGSGKLNFSRMDRVFDFILQNGMKPYIDFEEKPERINQDIHRQVVFNHSGVLFENREHWERTFSRMISHLLTRYGEEEMENWMLEIGQFRFYKSSLNDEDYYFEMFDYIYRTIRAAVPGLKIGGTVISEFFSAGETPELFLNHWYARRQKPDFLAMISYAYETDGASWFHYTCRSKYECAIRVMADDLKKKLAFAGFPSDTLTISEFNISVSERNFINDTAFKGAWIIRNLLEMYGLYAGLGYFMASDQIMEHFDSSDFLFGGNGLITKEGILKPAAWAFRFVKDLYPKVLKVTEHYMITTNGKDRYRMVCHNLVMPNYRYYLSEEDKLNPQAMEDYFDEKAPVSMTFELSGIFPGRYRIRVHRVNPEDGSVLHSWRKFGFIRDLSYADIDYIRTNTIPRMELKDITTDKNDRLVIELSLKSNEFLLLQADLVK